jgi:NDP-sugar pyrophosphorylase family protein
MRAVILAGGLGERLRPYTAALPKPLMPVGDYPILEIIIRQLSRSGVQRITLAVNHQAELLRAYFGDGSRWNLEIDYSLETKRLGTMAPLKLIDDLPENFFIMNGDVLTDLNFKALYDDHVSSKATYTISAYKRNQLIDFGVLKTNDESQLTGFEEKPKNEYLVSMGVYVASKEILDDIPEDTPYGFDDLMKKYIENEDKTVNVRTFDGMWLDIGRQDDYFEAIDLWPKIKDSI